jgi:hypothetical protein
MRGSKEKGTPVMDYRYKSPIRHVVRQPHWCPTVHCGVPTSAYIQRASLMPFSESRAPLNLALLTGSRYEINFLRNLFMNFFSIKDKIKKITPRTYSIALPQSILGPLR